MSQDSDLATLIEKFRALGADDPEGWANSELEEDAPQLARLALLKALYREAVEPWCDAGLLVRSFPVAAALGEEGASDERLATFAGCVAMNALYACLFYLSQGYDGQSKVETPGWALMEAGADGELTMRELLGLHESISVAAPTEDEAVRLFEGRDPASS